MSAPKLALCIPTHDGRAGTLKALLDSIAAEMQTLDAGDIEVCISDNASNDATAEVIAEFRSLSALQVGYFRFATDMRGVRNFVNVVAMARAGHCWLIGSDDMVPPGAIRRILDTLRQMPDVSGITFNKLNFDKTLSSYLGPDHDLVLPARPAESRMLIGMDRIAEDLALAYTFMSAHVFQRQRWQQVVQRVGIDYLCSTRHFPHTYIFLSIAATDNRWYWLSDYCIIQRMDNFCILDENSRHLCNYADELTHDLELVWNAVVTSPAARRSLMKRLFLIYWNPVAVFLYLGDSRITSADQRRLRSRLVQRFRHLALFWATTYPLLWVPAVICRGSFVALKALDRLLPLTRFWLWTHAVLSACMRRVRSGDRNAAGAESAANAYLK